MIEKSRISLFFILLCLFQAQNGISQTIVPFNPARITTGPESSPSIVLLDNGRWVITWQGPDANGLGVYAIIYNSDGTVYKPVFQVNTATTNDQKEPSVTWLLSGKFIISWTTNNGGVKVDDISYQIFNAVGTKDGAEKKANTNDNGRQYNSKIKTLSSGKFVITWINEISTSDSNIAAQVFNNADGSKSGTEFQVNTYTNNMQMYPSMEALDTGKFVITWQSQQDGSGYGVYAQIFNDASSKVGSEFKVNTETDNDQTNPAVTKLSTGQIVIAWQSSEQDGSGQGIFAKIYNADGTPSGSEFQVNSDSNADQTFPEIVQMPSAEFIIMFRDPYNNFLARSYGAGGIVMGDDFELDPITSTTRPSASMLSTGVLLLVGQSIASGIYAKSFCPRHPTQAFMYNELCYTICPSPVIKSYNYVCSVTCPIVAPYSYNNLCFTNCPAQAPYLSGQQCYVICPPDAPYAYNQQCYTGCPTVAPFSYNYKCYMACPPEAPKVNFNICSEELLKMTIMNVEQEIAKTAVAVTSVLNANNPFFVLLPSLSNMFLYIRYLRIKYPDNILVLFREQDVELFSISLRIDIPDIIQDNLPQRPLPDIFEAYRVQSSFLNNLWGPIVTLAAMLALTLVIIVLELLTRSCEGLNVVFKKLSSIAKWNMPLLVICGNYSDVIFYTSMELRTIEFDSPVSTWSFAACIVAIIISVLMLLLVFAIVKNIRNTKRKRRLRKNWDDFAILHGEYKQDSYFTLGYLLFFFGRDTIFNLLIANAFDYPLIQAIVLLILSASMLLYLGLVRPFKSIMLSIQIFANEIMLLIINVCILILAILDETYSNARDDRDNIGELLLIIYLMFSSANLFFIFIRIIQWTYNAYNKYRAANRMNLRPFTEVVKYILQSEPDQETQPRSRKPSNNFNRPRLRGSPNLTYDTSVMSSEIPNLSSSNFVLTHDTQNQNQNQRRLKRKQTQAHTSHSITLDLTEPDIDPNVSPTLSPNKGSQSKINGSKPFTVRNPRTEQPHRNQDERSYHSESPKRIGTHQKGKNRKK